ncbi:MAG: carboxypeptidase regulatory-like domain-containing protein [Myxococcaceae bacterium]|nr:carboxypeptidase regulatory-like domain-containing protein [Myxococcaceae bacterium]
MTRLWVVLGVVAGTGCLDVTLPERPPPPGPGTLQGAVVYSLPGKPVLPAPGARVVLQGTSAATVADDEGRFLLGGIDRARGAVHITFDVEGDGVVDRQRLLRLESVGAGPGRAASAGEVALGRNGSVAGRVRRADFPGDTFHLGIAVFVSGFDVATSSADTGAFVLSGLPEGSLELSFFTPGYRPDSRSVTLAAGQAFTLAEDVLLEPTPSLASTAIGVVRTTAGAPLQQALVRAVSASGAERTETRPDGTFTLGPLPSGAWVLAVEKEGYQSAALGRQLLLAGENDLGVIALSVGPSTSLPLDAGPVVAFDAGQRLDGGSADAGLPDAGTLDSGTPDAGTLDAGTLDGGTPDAGQVDGGTLDAGGPDAGTPDGGARLPCEGLCGPGFTCAADDTCRSTACALQSCALCNLGQCYSDVCVGFGRCRPGDVCDGTTCRPLSCAGVACGVGEACANGRCWPTSCSPTRPCRAGTVCLSGECVAERCVERQCGPLTLCVDGTCWPTGAPANPCAPGFARIEGQCREVACEGVSCPAGTQCTAGECVSGGLYVAGAQWPRNAPLQPDERYTLAGLLGGRWQKLASFPAPVQRLDISPDGTWLFALVRTEAGAGATLYRSQDGRSWTATWSGTLTAGGRIEDLHVDEATGALTMSVGGNQVSPLHKVLRSTDNGNTFSQVAQLPPEFGPHSFAPPNWVAVVTTNWLTRHELSRFFVPPLPDGGVFARQLPELARFPFFITDRTGVGPTFLSHPAGATYFLDGGIAGSFSATRWAHAVYNPPPVSSIFVLTPTAVARSFDGARSWSLRAPPVSSPSFRGLARGADGALYVANETGAPPLLVSQDEGETWATVPTNWARVHLSSFWPEWQPSSPYARLVIAQPSDAKATGSLYRVTQAGTSGAIEPDWADGGAGPIIDGTVLWERDPTILHEMRPTAMVSRACAPGQQRCGGGCVSVASSAQHCGACDQPCTGTCVAGRCLAPGSTDGGLSVGCADGTREGFTDVLAFPDVAACGGGWQGDLDTSTSAEQLCGPGWRVCTHADAPVRALSFTQATAFPGCFAFRASVDGFDGCEPLDCSNDVTRDTVAAVGASCGALSGVSRLVPDGGACFSDRGAIASQCCNASVAGPGRAAGCPQRGESGVLCCR